MLAALARLFRNPPAEPVWVDVAALRQRMAERPAPLILDVRGADEFDGPLGHIADARNIPLPELAARREEIAGAGRPIVCVCLTDRRSAAAAAQLTASGVGGVSVLRGGMKAWREEAHEGNGMKITICGIPELGQHCAAGVTHVLSILDPGWPDPEAFNDFPPHRRVALRFDDIIADMPGETMPTADDVAVLLEFGREVMAAGPGAHLLIHCHAGISRSTASAALLLAQADPARPGEAIVDEIVRLRPRAWPNLLLLEYGEAALDRRGEIVPAVIPQYRRVLDADPVFARFIRESGRAREAELAARK